PGDELAALEVELLGLAPDAQEHVLRHILGHMRIPHDAQDDRIHQVAVAVVYGLERREIAVAEALHQLVVTECARVHALQLPRRRRGEGPALTLRYAPGAHGDSSADRRLAASSCAADWKRGSAAGRGAGDAALDG